MLAQQQRLVGVMSDRQAQSVVSWVLVQWQHLPVVTFHCLYIYLGGIVDSIRKGECGVVTRPRPLGCSANDKPSQVPTVCQALFWNLRGNREQIEKCL